MAGPAGRRSEPGVWRQISGTPIAAMHHVATRTPMPLAPARERRKTKSPVDRRQSLRLVVVDWLYCIHSQALTLDAPILLRDLSLGGFAFESALNLPRGTEHRFQFTPEDGEPFTIVAESMHCTPIEGETGRYLTGLRFQRTPEQEINDPVKALIDRIHQALSI
jgi:hypothetical protein